MGVTVSSDSNSFKLAYIWFTLRTMSCCTESLHEMLNKKLDNGFRSKLKRVLIVMIATLYLVGFC